LQILCRFSLITFHTHYICWGLGRKRSVGDFSWFLVSICFLLFGYSISDSTTITTTYHKIFMWD